MPSGGGRAGGGGGGGFSGGGYHGGRGNGGRGRCDPFGWVVCFIVTLPIAAILALSLSLSLLTEPSEISSTETYALTDNRIIAYKGDFCQDLRVTSMDEPENEQAEANLYFMMNRPLLTERESFNESVTANLDFDLNFRYWNFYLNAGSKTSFTVCYRKGALAGGRVIFYTIKGTDQLNDWIENPIGENAEQSYPLTSNCDTIYYQVYEDSMYYFVFYLSAGISSVLDVNFAIYRTLYSIPSDDVVSECSFPLDGRSSCAISSPFNPGYTAVLALNASRPINYSKDGAEIRIGCQARAWLYAVIVVIVALVFVVVYVGGIFVCVKLVQIIKPKAKQASTVTTVNTLNTETTFSYKA